MDCAEIVVRNRDGSLAERRVIKRLAHGIMNRESKGTTGPGFVNRNGQVVIWNTGMPGTDHLQKIYKIGCSRCGHIYGANGSDIHDRKCPNCQGGEPTLPV